MRNRKLVNLLSAWCLLSCTNGGPIRNGGRCARCRSQCVPGPSAGETSKYLGSRNQSRQKRLVHRCLPRHTLLHLTCIRRRRPPTCRQAVGTTCTVTSRHTHTHTHTHVFCMTYGSWCPCAPSCLGCWRLPQFRLPVVQPRVPTRLPQLLRHRRRLVTFRTTLHHSAPLS